MLDGIEVVLDEWDLKEGHDKYEFMEQMVVNLSVNKVLLICNKEYKEKADNRSGGVGAESLIVSGEVYSKTKQEKFIPIVMEYDNTGSPYLPTFIKSRIYIDLSQEDSFEDNYEKLIRNIYNKPLSQKPPLGTPPQYIQIENALFLPTAHKVNALKTALINEKKNINVYIDDYFETFLSSLDNYNLDLGVENNDDFDELVLRRIEEMKPLRDDFINFLETYLKYSLEINIDKLHRFLEKLLEYLFNKDGIDIGSHYFGSLKHDHFRFFYYELFLYLSTVMIEYERFQELGFLLKNPFFFYKKTINELSHENFVKFYNYLTSLDDMRNKKRNLNRVSVTADLIKQREHNKYTFENVIQTDIVLYYISVIFVSDKKPYFEWRWFPTTSCYYSNKVLPLLAKAVSNRHFEKIKFLFDVLDKDELLFKLNDENFEEKNNYRQTFYFNIPKIKYGLNIDKLCTMP